ncbi:MAG: DNA starvation/stationary phase protection protein [Ignavibacteriales bacterium]|nr:DNA starvation/stationary phase protection protein [Ignavibacteriales bacterium]
METTLNRIGLEEEAVLKLAEKLNKLLADYQLFYINTRGFHWNIKGDKFFELHLKFEELYTDLQLKNDEIAERILTLGFTPYHSYSDYLVNSDIKEAQNISDGKKAVEEILKAFGAILPLQKEILKFSADVLDEGTNGLMSSYIQQQEKLVWMYSAYLNK